MNEYKERIEPVLIAARGRKTGINFMIFILLFVENCLLYNAMPDFSVLLRTISMIQSRTMSVCLSVYI